MEAMLITVAFLALLGVVTAVIDLVVHTWQFKALDKLRRRLDELEDRLEALSQEDRTRSVDWFVVQQGLRQRRGKQ